MSQARDNKTFSRHEALTHRPERVPPSRTALARGQARRQTRARQHREQLVRRAGWGAIGMIAAGLVVLAIVLPSGYAGPHDASMGATTPGPAIGTSAPAFSLTDVISRRRLTLQSFSGHKTLLFFSEGVGCQACMVQAVDLQNSKPLSDAGIQLVSITTDSPVELSQAAQQYGIRTPLLADPTTTMSSAYGMLGHGGMEHPTQDGHAFMLLDANGTVVWHRAYQSMYVDPNQLLSDMGVKA